MGSLLLNILVQYPNEFAECPPHVKLKVTCVSAQNLWNILLGSKPPQRKLLENTMRFIVVMGIFRISTDLCNSANENDKE